MLPVSAIKAPLLVSPANVAVLPEPDSVNWAKTLLVELPLTLTMGAESEMEAGGKPRGALIRHIGTDRRHAVHPPQFEPFHCSSTAHPNRHRAATSQGNLASFHRTRDHERVGHTLSVCSVAAPSNIRLSTAARWSSVTASMAGALPIVTS